jgi:hypothetical protein
MDGQVGLRPSSATKPRRTKRERPKDVGQKKEWFSQGKCIWTGRPLRGRAAQHWLRLMAGVGERENWCTSVVSIDRVLWEGDEATITFTIPAARGGLKQQTVRVEVREEDVEGETPREKIVLLVG